MTEKTKTTLKTVLLLSLSLIFVGVLTFNTFINLQTKDYSGTAAEKEEKNTEIVYRVSEYQGKLAVFLLGEDEPIEVYDLFLTSLPPKDHEMLKDGILVYDNASLQQLIEDYTS